MCLAVPGRVIRWVDRDPLFARAELDFNGLKRECCMSCVTDVEPGDYVIVHAGIAISRIDQEQVRRFNHDMGDAGTQYESQGERPSEIP